MNQEEEIWRDSVSLAGVVMVSSLGRVKRLPFSHSGPGGVEITRPERVLHRRRADWYPKLCINHDGEKKSYFFHRLVAEVFVPNPQSLPCVNHMDGDKSNPHPDNLEWCTHQQNMAHAAESGLTSCATPVQASKGGTGFWFPSMEIAMRHTKVSKPCICAAAKKKQKTAGGMVWDYTDKIAEEFTAKGVVFDDLLSEGAPA